MRPPAASEVLLLARVLMRLPARHRRSAAGRFLAEVEAAARHATVTGLAHPSFGDGSLAARCLLARPSAEPFADDADFLSSLIIAARAVRRQSRA